MNKLAFLCMIASIVFFTCKVSKEQSYYTGDAKQDSLIKRTDDKFRLREKVRVAKNKIRFGSDSLVYYAVDKSNNQLVSIGFIELKRNKSTSYDLINGELIRVRYMPDNYKRVSTIYYYEKNKIIYKRERNSDTPDGQKFIDDILFFKKALSVL
jgi:hypothetical protein